MVQNYDVNRRILFKLSDGSDRPPVVVIPYQTKLNGICWFCLAHMFLDGEIDPISGGYLEKYKFLKVFLGSPTNEIEKLKSDQHENCLLVLGENPDVDIKSYIENKIKEN